MKSAIRTNSIKSLLLASAVVVGAAGYGLGSSNLLAVTPSYAEAVKLEAPAAFSFADVVDAVSPAVVSVRVEASLQPASDRQGFDFERRGRKFFEEFFRERTPEAFPRGRNGKPHLAQSQGSGFFVSEDGFVVTNNHVIENGSKFTVVMSDGSEHEAELIGTDKRTDLAVLKVSADQTFTYVDFGEKRPRIGEWVVAVGNPFGLGGTVTAGIVSAHGREIGATRYDDFIQIDAAVNKGNSGGPAFNLNGEVIGVNTAIFSPSGGNVGIAFAIPAALADEVISDLIDNGSVTRGWLGVQIQPVTSEIGDALGLDIKEGAIVTSAQEGSPAENAGLVSGDIITKVDGQAVSGPRALAKTIAGYEPNAKVSLTIWRNGKEQTVEVTLGELETANTGVQQSRVEPARLKRLGLTLQKNEDGLQVTDVKPGSRADRRGIRPGDIIVAVNGTDIETLSELRSALKTAKESGRKGALLQLKRGEGTVFVPVPVARG